MKKHKKIIGLTVVASSLLFVMSACTSSTDVKGVETSDTTEATVAEDSSESSSSTSIQEPSSPVSTTNVNIAGGNNPEDYLMPNVVCMNLQEAQDEIQDRGVFYSRSVDLSGQDRNQIIDSNWIVLEQTPAPGTKITEGDAILGVVKIGESTRGIC